MRLSQGIVERNRFARGRRGLLERVPRTQLPIHCACCVIIRDAGPGQSVIGLEIHGFPEVFAGFAVVIRKP